MSKNYLFKNYLRKMKTPIKFKVVFRPCMVAEVQKAVTSYKNNCTPKLKLLKINQNMFKNIASIQNYLVYQYQFMDHLSAVLEPQQVYNDFYCPLLDEDEESDEEKQISVEKAVEAISTLFKNNGWEGDGDIGIIWIPPFIDIGFAEDTYGCYLWHVKQRNNGISFIATPKPLNLNRLNEQNKSTDYPDMEPINIIQDSTEVYLERLHAEKKDFDLEYRKITTESDDVSKSILNKLLGYTQCALIAQLNEFMDNCYLALLQEVLSNGNKGKIKLRKSSVSIDLTKHSDSDLRLEDSLGTWMSIQMFITDIWRSYRFEPFSEKYTRLIKSLDFTVDQDLTEFILKHTIIRNCIQHHDWELNAFSLKPLGRNSIQIKTENKPLEIKEWALIILTKQEIDLLFENLNIFATNINTHTDSRVKTRHYRTTDGSDSILIK